MFEWPCKNGGALLSGLYVFRAWTVNVEQVVGPSRFVKKALLALQLECRRPVTTSSMPPKSALPRGS